MTTVKFEKELVKNRSCVCSPYAVYSVPNLELVFICTPKEAPELSGLNNYHDTNKMQKGTAKLKANMEITSPRVNGPIHVSRLNN